MRLFSLAFLFGVCGILVFKRAPSLTILFVIFFITVLLHLYFRKITSLVLLAIICGFCWVMLHAHFQLAKQLPKSLEGKTSSVVGTIISLPAQHEKSTSFLFKTILIQDKPEERLLKLSWYKNKYRKKVLHAGDKWRLLVHLKRPHGFMIPGGYDYEAYAFQRGITAVGYVLASWKNRLIDSHWYHQPIERLRQNLQQKTKNNFSNQALAGFLPALIVGSRTNITAEQWQVLRNTGTNHLIAIAGLHVGLIAGLVFFLVSFIWCRIEFLTLRFPAQQAAALLSLIVALFYSLLAGFPLQTQRALIMLAIVLGALIFKRCIVPWYSWCLALLIVLIVDPLNVMTMGFWMSFAAVAAIIYGMHGRLNDKGIWWRWGRVQWVIMLSLIPLSLWIFHEAALISLVANVIAVPWFGFIVMPLCFFGSIALFISQYVGYFFLWLALKNLQCLWLFLQFLAHLPMMTWQHALPNYWLLGFAVLTVVLLLAPRGFPGRYLSIAFLLPVLTFHNVSPKYGNAWFTLLDVGQGLASVVRTEHHVLIFDTGPSFSDDFDAGSAVIVPYFSVNGLSRADMLMVSHGDDDHIGGAKSVLQNITVNKILSSAPKKLSNKAGYCYEGQKWEWDGVKFSVLSPKKGAPYIGNNSSCVLRIDVGHQSILLTGDIEHPIEAELLQHEKDNLLATILVAPHHGSASSSTISFIEAVYPRYVLFPTGYLNRFHFPNNKIVQRYKRLGAKQYNVAYEGAIAFKLDGFSDDIRPHFYRLEHQHIWRVVNWRPGEDSNL